jgi:hypothetical protein
MAAGLRRRASRSINACPAAIPRLISHAPVAMASSGVSFHGHAGAACRGTANKARPSPSNTTACTASIA